MEAAGWQAARHCRGRTVVVCGKGNNGGDGFAAARHLARWGRLAAVACADGRSLDGPAKREAEALEAAGVAIELEPRFEGAQVVLDALLGTGLSRPPEEPYASWIAAVNASGLRVVAVDLPSGLNADSGAAEGACVEAHLTVTLGLPKRGLLLADGPRVAGEIWLADIGIPFAAYEEAGGAPVPAHLFAMHDRVQLAALRL
jgi:ADP-dependent NAD(P)H-hydrate dehydratase / NAD(P)H-hydrate epimerase